MKFSIVKKGYNPSEVDKHIEELQRQIADFKEKEDAITNAMINSQVAANNIIKNAEMAAEDMHEDLIKAVNNIFNSIENQKNTIKAFQEDYETLISKYLKKPDGKDFLEIYTSLNELENYLVELKRV
ncbi:MAG: DivIVA domain-containing protein [Defluviitaleaceae bacterium]|nr:DivIVA domain-containing protein [Defluviitaleaceae bacterium]